MRYRPTQEEATPEIDSYEPGTPSWVDMGTPDVQAAVAFYMGLFGWEAPEADEATGGYVLLTLQGRAVAGIGPQQDPGMPYWTTYISVSDADATAGFVEAAGGQVLLPPMDVMTFGRMAVCADTEGTPFSIWQPKDHPGAGIVNEHGALIWNELTCRNPDAARVFYGTVFGWTTEDIDPDGNPYTQWQLNGHTIGGMMPMVGDSWPGPEELPSHWMVYFAVDDTDAAAARCTDLGGSMHVEPTDIPPGRFAVLSDPQGAHFSVIKPVPMD
ncbi:MAG: VOC family protein [Acidimicrobiales bacterium]|nr:VOC family protein [Acidimicrobiales bacterium]